VRLYLSSFRMGDHPEHLAALVGAGGRRAVVIANAMDDTPAEVRRSGVDRGPPVLPRSPVIAWSAEAPNPGRVKTYPGGQGRPARTARCSDTSVSSRSGRASVQPARTMDRTSSTVAPARAR